MLTFSDWEKLSESQQNAQISALLIACRYREDTNSIYRPIKMVPELFGRYRNSILQKYPDGEHIHPMEQSNLYGKYTYLYNWITGGCMKCYNHSLVWDIDNNSFVYYCRYCGDKKEVYTFSEL
jgi:hypothetical protein